MLAPPSRAACRLTPRPSAGAALAPQGAGRRAGQASSCREPLPGRAGAASRLLGVKPFRENPGEAAARGLS